MIHRRTRARQPVAIPRSVPILLLLVSLAAVAVAQPTHPDSVSEKPAPLWEIRPLVFGGAASVGLLSHAASFTVLPASDECGTYGSASSATLSLEIFLHWRTPWLEPLWLTARAGYRSLDARLVSTESIRVFENQFENEVQFGTMVTRYDLERSAVEIATGAMWALGDRWRVGLAPSLTLAAGATATHTDSLVSPREARFAETGLWTRPMHSGTILDFNPVVVGLEATAGAVLPTGSRTALYPTLRAGVSLTSHSSTVPWRTWTLGASIGFGYDVGPRDSIVTPIVEAIPDPPRRRPYLRATISARGVDEEGREYPNPIIEIEQTPWIEVVPMLPYVFFDSAATTIAPRYRLLTAPAEADRFSVDSLLEISPIDVHRQVLNVIGRRLRTNPRVTGTIIGTGSADEAPASASTIRAERAESVRRYLVSVWGIDPGRLRIGVTAAPALASGEETPEGRAENRRVEFDFSDPTILDAVVVTRMATIASPPAVKFSYDIVADTLVAEWSIAVVQGEKELLRFAGSGDEESLKQNKLWSLADLRINRDLSEIRYRLDVRDVTGQTTAADGRFRVVERARTTGDDSLDATPTLIEHFLVGFNYNSSELQEQHRLRLDEIARTVTPSDELLLVGYTDRIGPQERNRLLSLQRAQAVYSALRDPLYRDRLPDETATTVRGYGPQEELFDNAVPEGRMFSRMVRVVITSYRDE